MLMLQEGIKIFCPSGEDLSNSRVWLSSGTVLAANVISDSCYCAGAIVPQIPWRSPTAVELDLLWAHDPPPRELGIGIVQLPPEILAAFVAEGVQSVATVEEVKAKLRHQCQSALSQLTEFFAPFCLSETTITINGMGARPPGLWTSTFDRQRQCQNGLHTDSWDKLPLSQKHLATNRICVNLGCEDRFFLFINLPEVELLKWLGQWSAEALAQPWLRELTQEFMQRYPKYPVVKLRISPGEAYIAPTENMIHDATTLDMQHLDIKVMLRGHYRLQAASVEHSGATNQSI